MRCHTLALSLIMGWSLFTQTVAASDAGGIAAPSSVLFTATGEAKLAYGDWDGAILDLDVAITLNPRDARGYFLRARANAERARDLGNRSSADRALADAARALELNPQLAEAHACLGLAHSMRCEHDRAVACCDRAIANAPGSALAHRYRGIVWWRQDDAQRALTDYTAAITCDSRYAWAYRDRADLLRYRGERDKALTDAEKAVELYPQVPAMLIVRSTVRVDRREYEKALAGAQKVLRLAPNDSLCHLALANVQIGQREFKKALESIDKAAKQSPDSAVILGYRANCLVWMGQPDLALADCRRALQWDPTDRYSHTIAIDAFMAKQESGRALAACNAALRLYPKDAELFTMRADAKADRGDTSGSTDDLATALRHDPRLIKAMLSQAANHLVDEKNEEALAAIERALAVDPNDGMALAYKAGCLESMGMAAQADKAFAAALRIDKSDAFFDRGWVRIVTGDQVGGMEDLNHGIAARPGSPSLLLYRAYNQLFTANDVAKALADVEAAIQIAPENSYAYFLRAQFLDAKEDYRGAMADLGRALAIDPAFVGARAIRAQLLLEKEKFGEALDDCDDALAIDPDDGDSLIARAKLFAIMEEDPQTQRQFMARTPIKEPARDFGPPVALLTPGGVRIREAATPIWLAGKVNHQDLGGTTLAPVQATSPDGRRFAVALGSSGAVGVFDASSGTKLRQLQGHAFGTTAVCFTPDGKRLLTAGKDACLRMWDAATGRELDTFPDAAFAVRCLACSPDGRIVVTGHANDAGNGVIRIWDLQTQRVLHHFEGHSYATTGFVFLPDGHLLSCGLDGVLCKWDVTTGKALWKTDTSNGILGMAVSKDARRALTFTSFSISLWELADKKIVWTGSGRSSGVHAISFGPDERRAFVQYTQGSIESWRLPLTFEQAIADTDRATQILPQSSDPLLARGMCYFAKDRYGHAKADFTRAIELDAKQSEAYYFRALIHLRAGDPDRALKDLNAAIDINPKDGEAIMRRGLIYLKKGEFKNAKNDMDQALKIDPKLTSLLPAEK